MIFLSILSILIAIITALVGFGVIDTGWPFIPDKGKVKKLDVSKWQIFLDNATGLYKIYQVSIWSKFLVTVKDFADLEEAKTWIAGQIKKTIPAPVEPVKTVFKVDKTFYKQIQREMKTEEDIKRIQDLNDSYQKQAKKQKN